ncbi:MAG: hypothetical protein FWF53_03830 [Candidatus Azobacteroides sp.]|nr:hypothetical protein [Candidatus Azobacteroides sp.]
MIKYESLHQDLLTQLKKKAPQHSKLVTQLVDILRLDRTAVYRRLRGEVPFGFEEIMIIVNEFNISLDNMLGVDARTTLPFRFQPLEKGNPIEIDYSLLDEYLQAIKDIASDPKGEISSVTNLLPQLFYTGFKSIYRFYYFKWLYYSIPAHQIIPYHEIIFPEKLVQIAEDIFTHSKNIKTGYYILDSRIFQNFIDDVSFFNSIRLITDDDVRCIKDELFRFLDYMEAVAEKGFADDPSNKVFIYISDTNIDTSYYYVDSQYSFRFVLIWSFIFNSILTFDEETLKMMKHRIRSIIRTSTLLSVAGGKQRSEYFEKKRKIVEQL